MSYWGKYAGEEVVWQLANGANSKKKITGIQSSIVQISCKSDLDPTKRVEAMKRLRKILADARKANPEKWGAECAHSALPFFKLLWHSLRPHLPGRVDSAHNFTLLSETLVLSGIVPIGEFSV